MKRSRRSRQRGFTLMEMIIATVLLAIAIVGALSAISSSTRATEAGERVQTAAILAQRKLTELEIQASNLTSGEQQGDFGAEYPEYRWQATMDTTEFDKLLRVTLIISWGDPSRPNRREFVTYLRQDIDQTPEEQEQNNPNSSANTDPNAASGAGGMGGTGGGALGGGR
jgi:general secretion pathway protein I